jgi:chromosome segregation ATPase
MASRLVLLEIAVGVVGVLTLFGAFLALLHDYGLLRTEFDLLRSAADRSELETSEQLHRSQGELEATRAGLRNAEQELATVVAKLSTVQHCAAEAETELHRTHAEMERLAQRGEQSQAQVRTAEATVSSLTSERDRLVQALSASRETLRRAAALSSQLARDLRPAQDQTAGSAPPNLQAERLLGEICSAYFWIDLNLQYLTGKHGLTGEVARLATAVQKRGLTLRRHADELGNVLHSQSEQVSLLQKENAVNAERVAELERVLRGSSANA